MDYRMYKLGRKRIEAIVNLIEQAIRLAGAKMKARRGISPVIATVIIVAVAIAIALAVASWLFGIWDAEPGLAWVAPTLFFMMLVASIVVDAIRRILHGGVDG